MLDQRVSFTLLNRVNGEFSISSLEQGGNHVLEVILRDSHLRRVEHQYVNSDEQRVLVLEKRKIVQDLSENASVEGSKSPYTGFGKYFVHEALLFELQQELSDSVDSFGDVAT